MGSVTGDHRKLQPSLVQLKYLFKLLQKHSAGGGGMHLSVAPSSI
jgi:hypothetical protein